MKKSLRIIAAALAIAGPGAAFAAASLPNVQITEWMYNGNGATGEYIEFTNMGSVAVSFAGWSFDDSSRMPGSVSLSDFGLVGAGESVILTEATAEAFRSAWNLGAGVKVIGGNENNIGRGDEINLYATGDILVDRLTYGDAIFPGTIRAQNASGNPLAIGDLASETITANWVLAAAGDAYGSYYSVVDGSSVDLGNPGTFIYAPVPEPGNYAMLLAGLGLIAGFVRRRKV